MDQPFVFHFPCIEQNVLEKIQFTLALPNLPDILDNPFGSFLAHLLPASSITVSNLPQCSNNSKQASNDQLNQIDSHEAFQQSENKAGLLLRQHNLNQIEEQEIEDEQESERNGQNTPGFTSSQFHNDISPALPYDVSPDEINRISSFGFIDDDDSLTREEPAQFGTNKDLQFTAPSINKQPIPSFGKDISLIDSPTWNVSSDAITAAKKKQIQDSIQNSFVLSKGKRKMSFKSPEDQTSSQRAFSSKSSFFSMRKGSFSCVPNNNENEIEEEANSVIESSQQLTESPLLFQKFPCKNNEESAWKMKNCSSLNKNLEQLSQLVDKVQTTQIPRKFILNSQHAECLQKITRCLVKAKQLVDIPIFKTCLYVIQFQIYQNKFKILTESKQKAIALKVQKSYQKAFNDLKANLKLSIDYVSSLQQNSFNQIEELKQNLSNLFQKSLEMAIPQSTNEIQSFIKQLKFSISLFSQTLPATILNSPLLLEPMHSVNIQSGSRSTSMFTPTSIKKRSMSKRSNEIQEDNIEEIEIEETESSKFKFPQNYLPIPLSRKISQQSLSASSLEAIPQITLQIPKPPENQQQQQQSYFQLQPTNILTTSTTEILQDQSKINEEGKESQFILSPTHFSQPQQ